jgi:peptide chain release factor 2
MKLLRAKLYELAMQEKRSAQDILEQGKSDISWGNQIRSYVLDTSRIKDLRTGVETANTQAVLDGGIDLFLISSLKQLSDKTNTK